MSIDKLGETTDEIIIGVPVLDRLYVESFEHFRERWSKPWIVVRPESIRKDDLDNFEQWCGPKTFVQLGYICNKADLKSCLNTDGDMLRKVAVDEFFRYQAVIIDNWRDHFAIPWRDYLGSIRVDEWRKLLILELESGETMLIYNDKELVGLCSIYRSNDCIGRSVSQIGWIWADGQCPAGKRAQIHASLHQWLTCRAGDIIQAGIHLYNTKSQRYFTRLGFTLSCLHIAI